MTHKFWKIAAGVLLVFVTVGGIAVIGAAEMYRPSVSGTYSVVDTAEQPPGVVRNERVAVWFNVTGGTATWETFIRKRCVGLGFTLGGILAGVVWMMSVVWHTRRQRTVTAKDQ